MRIVLLSAVLAGLAGSAAAAPAPGANDKLAAAVRAKDGAGVKAALAARADPNARLLDTTTPLFWAVERQDSEIVRMLLAAGASANVVDRDGATPLILACQNGDPEILKQLLDAKADAAIRRFDGVSALSLCAAYATAEVVERMAAAGGEVEGANPTGQTPLMYAAANGQAGAVAALLRRGAKVDAVTQKGFTALAFAARSGSIDTVRTLLDAGARVDGRGPDGPTALQIALYDDHFDIATLLVEKGAALTGWDVLGREPLQVAVVKRNVPLVKLMLAKGADPNGLTRLAYRVIADPDVALTAVGARPPPEARPKEEGATPPVAPPRRQYDFQKLGYTPRIALTPLLGAQAVQDPPPATTPLMLAAKAGSAEIMKILVEAGARPDYLDEDGVGLLMSAVAGGKVASVEYALALQPKLTVTRGSDGASLIHVALTTATDPEGEAVVKLLAQKGAPLELKNARGQTPAQAIQRGSQRVRDMFAEVLTAHGPTQTAAAATAPKVN